MVTKKVLKLCTVFMVLLQVSLMSGASFLNQHDELSLGSARNCDKNDFWYSYPSLKLMCLNKCRQAQLKASLAVNSELIQLYWDIGKSIVEKQEKEGWCARIVEKLCMDLQEAFPIMQGFSRANIFRMRAFYLAYGRTSSTVRQLKDLKISKIPWGHNVLIMEKVKNDQERLWYVEQTIENGLSRAVLESWIKSKAFKSKEFMRSSMRAFFITGTSGSGKSTLTKLLQVKLPKDQFVVYDFDEKGVPVGADAAWRQATTEYWLRESAKNAESNKSTVICGVTMPTEVINASKKYNVDLYFGFMKISDAVIRQRLQECSWDEQLIQDNINWAHHLERDVLSQKYHKVVDCVDKSPELVANEFVAWFMAG